MKVSFKATNKETGDYQFKEFTITVPGAYQKAAGDNPAPTVVPELREWKGTTGSFAMGSRVLYADDSLRSTAEALAADYADLFGGKLSVERGKRLHRWGGRRCSRSHFRRVPGSPG